jgi:phytoene dehydrogenase-like protein
MWRDQQRTLAEIARFSPRDAEAYPRYGDFVDRLARIVEPLLLTEPPPFPPPSPFEAFDYFRFAGRLRGLDSDAIAGLTKIFTQSAAEFLGEWFESDRLRATLATDGVIGANGGPMSPGTAYVLLHHYMGGVGGVRGLW